MAFENAPQEVVECRVEGILTSVDVFVSRWMNVWHFCRDAEDPLDVTDPLELYGAAIGVATALHGRYGQEVMPVLSNQCAIVSTRGKIIAPIDSAFAVFGDAVVGAIAQAFDEPDDALVVTKRTYLPGRNFLGRVYVPGIPDNNVSGGAAPGSADSLAAAFRTLVDSPLIVNGETWLAGVWSATIYQNVPTVLAAFGELANVEVDAVIRRQTRRDIKERIPSVGFEP